MLEFDFFCFVISSLPFPLWSSKLKTFWYLHPNKHNSYTQIKEAEEKTTTKSESEGKKKFQIFVMCFSVEEKKKPMMSQK